MKRLRVPGAGFRVPGAGFVGAVTLTFLMAPAPQAQQTPGTSAVTVLLPTRHPPVPGELSQFWLAPASGARRAQAANSLLSVVRLTSNREYTKALGIVTQPAAQQGPLAQYAAYYAALAQLRLGKEADALKMFRALRAQKPMGYLAEAAAYGEADALSELKDTAGAVKIHEEIVNGKPSHIEDALIRLGRAYKADGHTGHAGEAFARVFYEYALSEEASIAGTELSLLDKLVPVTAGSERYKLELGRAERFYAARQYQPARNIFDGLKAFAEGDDKELVNLRIAECDYYLKKQTAARQALRPLAEQATRKAEALYFLALSARALRDDTNYLNIVARLTADFPAERWTEDALDNLGDYFLKKNDDERADQTFRKLYQLFPRGSKAENAAWKAGWNAYRNRKFQDTVYFFDHAAADFPRSDFRPAWLYWSGRAYEQLKDKAQAEQRYALELVDYMNTYYGRLTVSRLGTRAAAVRNAYIAQQTNPAEPAAMIPLPPNGEMIRTLLAMEMYEDALNELRYAQRAYSDSSAIQATIAWIYQQQARSETGNKRFELVRGGINIMKRAYPQYLTAGGEDLPKDVLAVIFPLAYWDLIKKYSAANGLDPFLMAALIQQESSFVADIRSYANAYGLMQLLPISGREEARRLKITYSSRMLTQPESNIRLGTTKFANELRAFDGQVHLVLAGYNAGVGAVRRWLNERPGIEKEEFIDDIPYPQTQGYVKKLLAMAEDYRNLYGSGVITAELDKTPAAPSSKPAELATPPKLPPAPPAGRTSRATTPMRQPARAPASRRR